MKVDINKGGAVSLHVHEARALHKASAILRAIDPHIETETLEIVRGIRAVLDELTEGGDDGEPGEP